MSVATEENSFTSQCKQIFLSFLRSLKKEMSWPVKSTKKKVKKLTLKKTNGISHLDLGV